MDPSQTYFFVTQNCALACCLFFISALDIITKCYRQIIFFQTFGLEVIIANIITTLKSIQFLKFWSFCWERFCIWPKSKLEKMKAARSIHRFVTLVIATESDWKWEIIYTVRAASVVYYFYVGILYVCVFILYTSAVCILYGGTIYEYMPVLCMYVFYK